METIIKSLTSLAFSFVLLLLLGNIMSRFPRLPWDIYLDKFGFKVYIPFISAVVLSILFIYLSSFMNK